MFFRQVRHGCPRSQFLKIDNEFFLFLSIFSLYINDLMHLYMYINP